MVDLLMVCTEEVVMVDVLLLGVDRSSKGG